MFRGHEYWPYYSTMAVATAPSQGQSQGSRWLLRIGKTERCSKFGASVCLRSWLVQTAGLLEVIGCVLCLQVRVRASRILLRLGQVSQEAEQSLSLALSDSASRESWKLEIFEPCLPCYSRAASPRSWRLLAGATEGKMGIGTVRSCAARVDWASRSMMPKKRISSLPSLFASDC